MAKDFESYLESLNFNKHNTEARNLLGLVYNEMGETIAALSEWVLYGAGSLFQYIKENYDFTEINIIGISDKKFSDEQEGEIYLGYKIIPFSKITNYNADYVLIATQNYIGIVENFVCNVFDKTKTKVKPLVKIPLLTLIKEIWSR